MDIDGRSIGQELEVYVGEIWSGLVSSVHISMLNAKNTPNCDIRR